MDSSDELRRITLRNRLLQATFLPDFGGKICSLISTRTGQEFLLPPLHPYKRLDNTAPFDQSDAGGFDECLPSVAACGSLGDEPPIPDHGDLWRVSWRSHEANNSVRLEANATSRPLRLIRNATLHESTLVLRYELQNLSDQVVSWLWSAHPLFLVNRGDRIILPEDVQTVTVEGSSVADFAPRSTIAWPHGRTHEGTEIDLSTVHEEDGHTAHKLFARMRSHGSAALFRAAIGQGILLRFDPVALPYLGLWICHGAWPQSGTSRQYTVALEPTTSNADSLVNAEEQMTARRLGPRECSSWKIELELLGTEHPVTFQEVRDKVRTKPQS